MIAKTPSPPYYAVIFTSTRTAGDNGYAMMADKMFELAAMQDGFLGVESAREELGITVSYWQFPYFTLRLPRSYLRRSYTNDGGVISSQSLRSSVLLSPLLGPLSPLLVSPPTTVPSGFQPAGKFFQVNIRKQDDLAGKNATQQVYPSCISCL